MDFRYASAFGAALSTGYETLLLDVVEGDLTLFVHGEEAEASWRLFTPLLRGRRLLHAYPAGSDGPSAAARMLEATSTGA